MNNVHKRKLIIFGMGISLTLALLHFVTNPPFTASAHISPAQSAINTGFTGHLYLPLVLKGYPNFGVNPQDRQASLDFFNNFYLGSEGVLIGWTGNLNNCNEGTTAPAFRQAIQLRINYYRAMAGIPGSISLSDVYNQKAQRAALMMSVNNQLSHSPPTTWTCYYSDGAQAAGSSNLYLGVNSVNAIDGYMYDPGSGNYAIGHRRWLLFPPTEFMGTGDIPATGGYQAANALWVIDNTSSRPVTREEFVAWPPPGYVPYQVVFPRWSFSYNGAEFTSTSVSMTSDGKNIPVSKDPVVVGFGDNTFVWEPQITTGTPPAADKSYIVSINNVSINGSLRNFRYTVTVFDPGIQATNANLTSEVQLGIPVMLP